MADRNLVRRIIRKLKYYFSKTYFKIFTPTVICNNCGWGDFRFDSDDWHPYTICPNCYSQVRHRLFWAILDNHKKYNKDNLLSDKSVLHFVPERELRNSVRKLSSVYKTADFFTEGYQYENIDYNVDICNMNTIKDETFDCVIALDVLEHVQDDGKALSEINRVLKRGG